MRSNSSNNHNADKDGARRKTGSTRCAGVSLNVSVIHGTGIFATKSFKPGDRIIEYAGKTRRWSDCYDEEGPYTCLMELERNLVIDPRIQGNIARFVNHSCDPNCDSVKDGKKVFLYAVKKIRKGDELTIDYSLVVPPASRDESTCDDYVCKCGAPRCRGTMLLM